MKDEKDDYDYGYEYANDMMKNDCKTANVVDKLNEDYCTSLNCKSWGSEYCSRCSHYLKYGLGEDVDGTTWRWEFNPMFGPLFLDEEFEPLYDQPNEKSLCWDTFQKWYDERNK